MEDGFSAVVMLYRNYGLPSPVQQLIPGTEQKDGLQILLEFPKGTLLAGNNSPVIVGAHKDLGEPMEFLLAIYFIDLNGKKMVHWTRGAAYKYDILRGSAFAWTGKILTVTKLEVKPLVGLGRNEAAE